MELVDDMTLIDFDSVVFENEFDQHYGLLAPEQTVLVRAYSDDSDDRMLAEIRPKFIVMFEPNMEFIRRIEVSAMDPDSAGNTHGPYLMQVYKSSNPGLGVRVYHMVYSNSCEEHKYLAGIRKEKESFERLIKERGASSLFSLFIFPVLIEEVSSPCSYLSWRKEDKGPVQVIRLLKLSIHG
jgi:DNA excision repair protein ERCC-4